MRNVKRKKEKKTPSKLMDLSDPRSGLTGLKPAASALTGWWDEVNLMEIPFYF